MRRWHICSLPTATFAERSRSPAPFVASRTPEAPRPLAQIHPATSASSPPGDRTATVSRECRTSKRLMAQTTGRGYCTAMCSKIALGLKRVQRRSQGEPTNALIPNGHLDTAHCGHQMDFPSVASVLLHSYTSGQGKLHAWEPSSAALNGEARDCDIRAYSTSRDETRFAPELNSSVTVLSPCRPQQSVITCYPTATPAAPSWPAIDQPVLALAADETGRWAYCS